MYNLVRVGSSLAANKGWQCSEGLFPEWLQLVQKGKGVGGGLINLIHLARLTCNPNSTAVCSSRCFIISLSTSYCLSVALFLDLLEFSLGKIGTITIFFRIINFSTRIWSGSAHVPSIFGLFLFCFYFLCSFVSYTCVGNRGIECLIWSKTRGQPSVKLDQHNHFVFLGQTYSSRTTKTKRKTAFRLLVSSSVDSIFKKMPSWPSKLIFHISSHGVIWQTTRLHFFVFCFCFIFLLLSMVFLMESLNRSHLTCCPSSQLLQKLSLWEKEGWKTIRFVCLYPVILSLP